MRRGIVFLGVVGIAVVVAWIATRPIGVPDIADDRGVAARRPGGAPVASPPSAGAAGEIAGTVWRGGRPAAARVELLAVPAPDIPPDPRRETDPLARRAGAGPPLAVLETGDGGSFRFDGLAAGEYEIRATADDGASGQVGVRLRLPGERALTDVRIPDGPHVLRGRTVYADGRPFLGHVEVFGRRRALDHAIRAVRTDDEGRFEARGLPDGLVCTRCLVEGSFSRLGRWVRLPFDEELLVVVDARCAPLSGRVLAADGDRPVAGATVTARGDDGETGGVELRVRTDGEGRFRIALPPARRELTVRAAGFTSAERPLARDATSVVVRLDRTGSVSGRVLSADDGRPLPGIPVFWVPDPPASPDPGGRTVSDAAGRYVFARVAAGPVLVYALGKGHASPGLATDPPLSSTLGRTLLPGSALEIDLHVIAAARVRGRVVEEGGRGRPGVSVRIERMDDLDPAGAENVTITDREGRFFRDALVPDRAHRISAEPPGHAPVEVWPVVGASGETVEVSLVIPSGETPPRWLLVRVVEERRGAAVAGAAVSADGLRARTGADGTARIGPLGPGRTSVRVHHPDYLLLKNRSILDSAAGVQETTVRLRRGLAIAGRVLLPDGTPLENGNVYVGTADGRTGPDTSTVGEVTAGGRFRAGGLVAGTYRVKIGGTHDGEGYWVETVVEAGREDLVLTTARYLGLPERTVELLVTDPDGVPVPLAAAVILREQGDRSWTERVDVHDGREIIGSWGDHVRLTVAVFGAGTPSGAPLGLGPARAGPVSSEAGEIQVRLPPGRTIEGRVLAAGSGIEGIALNASPLEPLGTDEAEIHATARTDADGAFRLGGLGPGRYHVRLDRPAAYRPAEIPPVAAGVRDLEIVLEPAAPVRVTVLDPAGAPVGGAAVDLGGRHGATYTRLDGVAVLRGLAPEEPRSFEVKPPRARGELLPVRLEEWLPADTTVRFAAGLLVSGLVRGPDGSPAVGARVWASRDDRTLGDGAVEVARDGAFRLGPFPPGAVELRARRPPAPAEPGGAVVVHASRDDVVLTVGAGRTLLVRILDWDPAFGPVQARLTGAGEHQALVANDGTVEFTGLRPGGPATVFVGPVGDGLHVLLRGLGPDRTEVSTRLVRGGEIRGWVRLPAGAEEAAVRVEGGGFSIGGVLDETGAFRIDGVPPGDCVVTVRARHEGRRLRAHRWCRAGETIELELEKE